MIIGSECIENLGNHTDLEMAKIHNNVQCRKKIGRLDPEKQMVLKKSVLQNMEKWCNDSPLECSVINMVRDNFALSVLQVRSLLAIYQLSDEKNQKAMRQIIKVNLRTKREKLDWLDLSNQDKKFVHLFMSEDQRKRYRVMM